MTEEEKKKEAPLPNRAKIVDITEGRYIEIELHSSEENAASLSESAYKQYGKVLKDGKPSRKISSDYA